MLSHSLQVYYISKATLKVANKQYSSLKNDYEMTLHAHSSIVSCDDSQDIPTVHCDFVPIAELENKDKDSIVGKRQRFFFLLNIWYSLRDINSWKKLKTGDVPEVAWLFLASQTRITSDKLVFHISDTFMMSSS